MGEPEGAEAGGAGAQARPIHATTVARFGPGGWRGVLLTGPSGAGKSDLALRLMANGWRLTADDYSQVWASGGAAWATAPERIAGLIEARGLGIVGRPARSLTRLALVVACGQHTPERAPEAQTVEIAGIALPVLTLDIRPASASLLVDLALDEALADRREGGVTRAARGRFQSAPLSSI